MATPQATKPARRATAAAAGPPAKMFQKIAADEKKALAAIPSATLMAVSRFVMLVEPQLDTPWAESRQVAYSRNAASIQTNIANAPRIAPPATSQPGGPPQFAAAIAPTMITMVARMSAISLVMLHCIRTSPGWCRAKQWHLICHHGRTPFLNPRTWYFAPRAHA